MRGGGAPERAQFCHCRRQEGSKDGHRSGQAGGLGGGTRRGCPVKSDNSDSEEAGLRRDWEHTNQQWNCWAHTKGISEVCGCEFTGKVLPCV